MNSQNEILQLASAFQKSRIFLSAVELDVFTALDKDELSAEQVAAKIKADKKATARLLDALCSLDFIIKKNNLYSNTATSSQFLVKDKPQFMGGLMHTNFLWDSWSNLTKIVKAGQDLQINELDNRGKNWLRSFITAMHTRGIAKSKDVASRLDFKNVKNFLDVAGGSGIFASTFVKQNPNIKAVVLDLPNVIPLTKEFLKSEGTDGIISTISGDYIQDDFGSGYDMILLSAIIHSNSFDENKFLISKCAKALNPNGQLVISDYVLNEDRTKPVSGAMFAINMLIGTDEGNCFTKNEITSWLKDAGAKSMDFKSTSDDIDLVIAKF